MALQTATKTRKPPQAAPKKRGRPPAAPAKQAAAPKMAKPTTAAAKAKKPVTPKRVTETITLKAVFEQLAAAHDLPKRVAVAMAAGMVDRMTAALKAGDRVRMNGVGIFEVKHRAPRVARNPATGAAIEVPASRRVAFRAAKELKAAV